MVMQDRETTVEVLNDELKNRESEASSMSRVYDQG